MLVPLRFKCSPRVFRHVELKDLWSMNAQLFSRQNDFTILLASFTFNIRFGLSVLGRMPEITNSVVGES